MAQSLEHPETGEPLTQILADLTSDTKFVDLLMTWLVDEGDADSSDDLYDYCEQIFPSALIQAYVEQMALRTRKGS